MNNILDKGIELNGSETSSKFKLCLYLEADDMEEKEKNLSDLIYSCDIV